MSISIQNIQKKLLELGYSSNSGKTSAIFADAVDKVFFSFGETIQNGLIKEARKQTLTSNFMFPYYSIVKKSIIDFLGKTNGAMILNKINQELSKQTNIQGSTETILNEISKIEVLEKIKNFSGNEHVIYFWNEEKVRDRILNSFLRETKGPRGLISNTRSTTIPHTNHFTYPEIFENKANPIESYLQKIAESHENNDHKEPARFAGADCTQWFEKDLGKQFLKLEKEGNNYLQEKRISGLCAYNINKIPNELIFTELLEYHQYILLDEPFVIYERGN